jgi:hypothetical protein
MSPDVADDHLLPPTDPGAPLLVALDTACAVRRAIFDGLFEATNQYRDAMAARPLDGLRLARTCGEMNRLSEEWRRQAEWVQTLLERWDATRWRQSTATMPVAA